MAIVGEITKAEASPSLSLMDGNSEPFNGVSFLLDSHAHKKGGELKEVACIEHDVREEAKAVLAALEMRLVLSAERDPRELAAVIEDKHIVVFAPLANTKAK